MHLRGHSTAGRSELASTRTDFAGRGWTLLVVTTRCTTCWLWLSTSVTRTTESGRFWGSAEDGGWVNLWDREVGGLTDLLYHRADLDS